MRRLFNRACGWALLVTLGVFLAWRWRVARERYRAAQQAQLDAVKSARAVLEARRGGILEAADAVRAADEVVQRARAALDAARERMESIEATAQRLGV